MAIWFLELRRSPAKWLALPLAASLVALGVLGMRPGLVVWSDVNAALTQASVFLNPIIAGFVAWEAGRREKGGFEARLLTAARSSAAGRFAHFLAIVVWLALGGLVALGILVPWLGLRGVYGVPALPWLLSSALGSGAAAALGYVGGTAFKGRWFASPIVAVAVYLGWVVFSSAHLPYWIVQIYPTVLNGSDVFVRYVWLTIAGQSLWYLALIALLLGSMRVVTGRDRKVRIFAMVLGVAVAAAGVGMIASTGGQLTIGYNSRDFVCTKKPVDICVNRAYRAGLPELEATFGAFNGRAAGTPLEAVRLEQNEMGVGDEPKRGSRSVYVEDLGSGFAQNSLILYVETNGGIQQCRSATGANLHTIVDLWLEGQPPDAIDASTPEGRVNDQFQRLTDPQRATWLSGHWKAFRSCRLAPAIMP